MNHLNCFCDLVFFYTVTFHARSLHEYGQTSQFQLHYYNPEHYHNIYENSEVHLTPKTLLLDELISEKMCCLSSMFLKSHQFLLNCQYSKVKIFKTWWQQTMKIDLLQWKSYFYWIHLLNILYVYANSMNPSMFTLSRKCPPTKCWVLIYGRQYSSHRCLMAVFVILILLLYFNVSPTCWPPL